MNNSPNHTLSDNLEIIHPDLVNIVNYLIKFGKLQTTIDLNKYKTYLLDLTHISNNISSVRLHISAKEVNQNLLELTCKDGTTIVLNLRLHSGTQYRLDIMQGTLKQSVNSKDIFTIFVKEVEREIFNDKPNTRDIQGLRELLA